MGSLCLVVWNKHRQLKKQTQKQKTIQKQKPQLQRNNTTRTTATSAAALSATSAAEISAASSASSAALSAEIVTENETSPNTTEVQPQQQQQPHQPLISLSMVVKQSLVYVGVLYWIFIPHIIVSFMSVIGNRKHFGMNLFSCIVTDCLGLWIALMYWYFSTDDCASSIAISFKNMKHKCTPHQHHFNNNSNKTTTVTTVNSCAHCGDEENNNQEHGNEDEEISKPFSIKSSNSRDNSVKNKQKQRMKPRFSFNIFDGTAPANGRLSNFVFDGDDEDEINDEKESEYWSGCQNG